MQITRRDFLKRAFERAPDKQPAQQPLFRQYTPTPTISPAHWGLSIGGLVVHPFSLSYADLLAYPATDFACTMICASNPPGGERIGSAVWRGVPVSALLDEIEVQPRARYARLEAADGHTTFVPLERLRAGLLAYALDGAPLSPEQGAPARLVIPGLYDFKSPRWIERIELTERPVYGAWEARGWSADAIIQTTSAITAPRPDTRVGERVRFEGYAFAGERQITKIELRINGAAWMPVPFQPAQAHQWTRWQIDWRAPQPGDYYVQVRATDSAGFTQQDTAQPPFPEGTSALHGVVVRVRE